MKARWKLKHPYRDPGLKKSQAKALESGVERVMAMNEQEMLALAPVQTAIVFCGCPNCDHGQQEWNQLTWTIEKPHELQCRFCGHVYPSEKYPMDRSQTTRNPQGKRVTVRYHLDAAGNDHFFGSKVWAFQKRWLVRQAVDLARAYHVTHQAEYARRAALIIDRFAQLYPTYCVVYQWPFRKRRYSSRTKPPFPAAGGKWGRWIPDEIPYRLPLAYDLIYDSTELDRLSQELGADVRKRIENDFFRAAVAYTLTSADFTFNMVPQFATAMVRIGRIIGEPEYIHWVCDWLGRFVQTQFCYDGAWHEAPSYHYTVAHGLTRALEELKGYSDPPGYVGREDGLHFDDLDLEKELPLLRKVWAAPTTIDYPDGRACPVHDTWGHGMHGGKLKPKRKSSCRILPGYGHAVLGTGKGPDQVQAHLHFSGAYGHHHCDNLNFSLFAFGREMFSDLGYSHTKLRYWATCSVGHNLLVIDRSDQPRFGHNTDADLLMYVPDVGGLSVVEARGERGYPGLAEVYRRLVMLVSLDGTDPYVVDVFHAKGGRTHDWLLHGSADHDQAARCSLKLSPRKGTLLQKGERWVEPYGESATLLPYGLMRNVRTAKTAKKWSATLTYRDRPDLGVRTHVMGGRATDVFLCETPSMRRAGRDDGLLYQYLMPQLVVRRRGRRPLESVFVAVHEPFRGKPQLTRAELLEPARATGDVVALRVRLGPRTDTILISLDGPACVECSGKGGASLEGRIGFISQEAGVTSAAYLIGGTRLAGHDFELTADAATFEGEIEAAERKADGAPSDAFVTSADLPAGRKLRGSWMIVTHPGGRTHGYGIERVEKRGEKTWIHLSDDHGLRIAGRRTEECYFPQRTFRGTNRFVIYGTAAKSRKGR
ncbi:MAG: heparinase II/III family protein [Candidatus Brocadiae bacterium]|nr:heparinase II/III family protein [Candidatus Brocadiia bacterium]